MQNSLVGLLGSDARVRILTYFVAHPDQPIHGRALQRHTGVGKLSIQVELDRLVEMGLLTREAEGRRIIYGRTDHPEWNSLASLVSHYGAPLILQDLLRGISGLKAAFIFGSQVKGDARADSDIDLVLYGTKEAELAVARATLNASMVLDRTLDAKWYDHDRFLLDIEEGASFLPVALDGPVQWLVGSRSSLPGVERAA